MQIHELDNFVGALGEDTYFAIDDGVETTKVPASSLMEAELIMVNVGSINSLPVTVSDTKIKADMVCVNSELGTPSAQTSDWTVTTADGAVEVSGNISGTTSLVLYLMSSK